MDKKFEMQTKIEAAEMTRRHLIRWLLGFSVVSTLGGVLTPSSATYGRRPGPAVVREGGHWWARSVISH